MFDSKKNILKQALLFFFFTLTRRSETTEAAGKENPRKSEYLSFLTDDLASK